MYNIPAGSKMMFLFLLFIAAVDPNDSLSNKLVKAAKYTTTSYSNIELDSIADPASVSTTSYQGITTKTGTSITTVTSYQTVCTTSSPSTTIQTLASQDTTTLLESIFVTGCSNTITSTSTYFFSIPENTDFITIWSTQSELTTQTRTATIYFTTTLIEGGRASGEKRQAVTATTTLETEHKHREKERSDNEHLVGRIPPMKAMVNGSTAIDMLETFILETSTVWITRTETILGSTSTSTTLVTSEVIIPVTTTISTGKTCSLVTTVTGVTTRTGFEQKTTVMMLTQSVTIYDTEAETSTVSKTIPAIQPSEGDTIDTETFLISSVPQTLGVIASSNTVGKTNPLSRDSNSPTQNPGSSANIQTDIFFSNGASFIDYHPKETFGAFTTGAWGISLTFAILPSNKGAVVNGVTISPGSIINLNGVTVGYKFSSIYIKTSASGGSNLVTTILGDIPMTLENLPFGLGAIVNGVSILPGATAIVNGITLSYGPSGLVTLQDAKLASNTAGGSNGGPFEAITLFSNPALVIGGQTLTSGGLIVVSGTTYLLPTGGTIPVTATGRPIIINGQTLTPGGTVVVSGTTYLLPFGATVPITRGPATGSAIVIGGQTLTPGGTIVVSGTTYVLPSGATVPVVVTGAASSTNSAGGAAPGLSRTNVGFPQVTGGSSKPAIHLAVKILGIILGVVEIFLVI